MDRVSRRLWETDSAELEQAFHGARSMQEPVNEHEVITL